MTNMSDEEFNNKAREYIERILRERAEQNENEMKIHLFNDPCLRKISDPVEDVDKTWQTLATHMLIFCRRAGGVGLAAPQIGINKRIIVVDTNNEKPIYESYLFNPVIKNPQGSQRAIEGCLSVPGAKGSVVRYTEFDLEYLDMKGKPQTRHWTIEDGRYGIIVQHEIDHLDGILYVDKLNFVEKEKAYKVMNKLRRK